MKVKKKKPLYSPELNSSTSNRDISQIIPLFLINHFCTVSHLSPTWLRYTSQSCKKEKKKEKEKHTIHLKVSDILSRECFQYCHMLFRSIEEQRAFHCVWLKEWKAFAFLWVFFFQQLRFQECLKYVIKNDWQYMEVLCFITLNCF